MASNATDIAAQMIQQLRVLDPAISADPGTPERKIIDTVAVQIANSQLDLSVLDSGLNINAKFGANLDRFLALFNFGRQQAVAATGFVTFSRPNSPATQDILIPTGTQVVAPDSAGDIFFRTTFDVTLSAGQTSVVAPIAAVIAGARGNVAANTITELLYVAGIFAVTNELPTSGGIDLETDDAYKTRFQNTVFRNVSGTYDQYLALAVATPFTRKANVVGPISRYREYIQVPDSDDASWNLPKGNAGEYTSAMSTIPYSKFVYTGIPHFVSNGQLGPNALFFRPDTDFVLNVPPINRGDTARQKSDNATEQYWDAAANVNATRPNVTFRNVYLGGNDGVTALRPGDVVLFEHSYMSKASRNDWDRHVTNAVDVFIDGGNNVAANAVIPRPTTANMFVDAPTNAYHFDNYRREGAAEHRPLVGNLFTALFFEPVTDLPDIITVEDVNYFRGVHYWLVEDVSELHGTVRARNGIEWDKYLPGQVNDEDPNDATTWTGPTIGYSVGDSTGDVAPSVTITGYTYDKNVNDLQASLDANKQVTTDTLAHLAYKRYFKLDITVMYAPGANLSVANQAIRDAVEGYFQDQYFGATVQLSDVLQAIHSVPQVDNVRWSREIPTVLSEIDTRYSRMYAVNADGSPRTTLLIDYVVRGNAQRAERLLAYFTGAPEDGNVNITYTSAVPKTAKFIPVQATATDLRGYLRTITGDTGLTVTGSGTVGAPWIITYSAAGPRALLVVDPAQLAGGPNFINGDFYLQDNELPALATGLQEADTVPGLIIRPRAQGTWVRF